MTQTRQQQAIFPDLPRDKQVVDKDGNITSAWDLFFQQLVMALQTNLKPEGFVMPPQSAANIANLGNISGSIGNILYDSTNNQFKGIILVSLGPPLVTVTKTFTLT
jgi:hypothetical protein